MHELFQQLIVSGSIWSFFASFCAGLIASISPCIYPLIPITLGIIGAYSIHSHRKGFFMSFIFVLGIATIYTLLGVISASLGLFLGSLMVNPISYGVIGLFLLFLGLSLWGVFHIHFHTLTLHLTKKRSLFVVGMVAGFAAIPCIFPIMGTILSIISLQRSIVYGGIMLFAFSLGYGAPLMLLGTFSSLISKLPKTGRWLIIINRCVGTFLLFLAVYFFIKALKLLLA